MIRYNIANNRSSLEPNLISGLSGHVVGQPRPGTFLADPAARARRASATLVGSLLLHGLAALLILEIGRPSTPVADLPREVEVSLQFAGPEAGQPQPQAVPETPGAGEPSPPTAPSLPSMEPAPPVAAEPPPQVAEPTPQAAPAAQPPPLPEPVQPPPPVPDVPAPIPDAPVPSPPLPAATPEPPAAPIAAEPPLPLVPAPRPPVEPPPPLQKSAAPKPAPAPKPVPARPRPVSRPTPPTRPAVGTATQESQVPAASPTAPAGSPSPAAATGSNPPPAAAPGPEVTAGWRGAVSAWLQSHKTYPDEARQRGEEGSALVRFTVDRSGRVLEFALVRGTGSVSLDAAVARMLTGAELPAFPSAMTQDRTTVTVQVRYALQ
jgi:protein TonB